MLFLRRASKDETDSKMTKMVMVVYNEAIDAEVMELMAGCGIKNYTKITAACGRGETSGSHFGNDIWPGRNNILHIVCSGEEAKALLGGVRILRKELGAEGVKAFVWPLEEIT